MNINLKIKKLLTVGLSSLPAIAIFAAGNCTVDADIQCPTTTEITGVCNYPVWGGVCGRKVTNKKAPLVSGSPYDGWKPAGKGKTTSEITGKQDCNYATDLTCSAITAHDTFNEKKAVSQTKRRASGAPCP
ncbi:MAG: hypothetical protein EBY15_02845 [Gammaproteobacteria bacterium]|nr:hypothetical protein [Gammaproteobacteria bacterium]NDE56727.1 hypothetical protein [Gammaproteobacteria bacterium]NDG86870.1 hypothetical protein [Gammaproteobacteria bacterium]